MSIPAGVERRPFMEATLHANHANESLLGTGPFSRAQRWVGRVLSGLVIAFLVFDAGVKLLELPFVIEASERAGFAPSTIFGIGFVLMLSTILYAVPRTSIFGALLLTAYLGGATATHVRLGQPFVMPIVFGVVVWAGLALRDADLRALLFRTRSAP
jgi:hypothetical protein